jgi:hypothetical protein
VGGCLSVETHLSNEFSKTYIFISLCQFSFDAHGYKCVTRNKSLRIHLTVLHFYQFFVYDRCVPGLHSHLLKAIMNIDKFDRIPSLRNKSIIYRVETRKIISKICRSVTCLL